MCTLYYYCSTLNTVSNKMGGLQPYYPAVISTATRMLLFIYHILSMMLLKVHHSNFQVPYLHTLWKRVWAIHHVNWYFALQVNKLVYLILVICNERCSEILGASYAPKTKRQTYWIFCQLDQAECGFKHFWLSPIDHTFNNTEQATNCWDRLS